MLEKKVYCRYEGDNSQRHLEASPLNWAMREGVEWGRGLVGMREEDENRKSREGNQKPKRLHAQIECGYTGIRGWGRESQTMGWRARG